MDNVRKFATVAGFIPQIGVRGQRRAWRHSQSAAKFQSIEQATLLGGGGARGVASTTGRVPGSAVWYQYANSKSGAGAYSKQLKKPKHNILGRAMDQFGPANITDTIGITSSVKDNEEKFIKDAFSTYRKQVATYSKTLLSEINDTAGLGKRDYGVKDIKPTPGAMMPSEQTTVIAEMIDGAEAASPISGKPIGATQPIDAIYKVGDKYMFIEETEMLASEGGHHGINVRMKTQGEIDAMLKEEDGGEKKIKKLVKDYFNNEIKKKWNPAIRNIRSIAKEVYGKKNVTPEQMRMPDMMPTNINSRGEAKRYMESTSKAALQRLLKPLAEENSKQNTNSTIEHINHYIGTFNAHLGKGVSHGITVSRQPHVSASAELRQFSSKASRAYEFKQVKKVGFYQGWASLGILREQLKGSTFSTEVVMDKAKATHLGTRLGVNGGSVMVNTVTGVKTQLGANPRAGFAYYIPENNKTRDKLINDYANKLLDDMATGLQGPEQKIPAMKVGTNFQRQMDNLEKASIRSQNLTPEREYRFWASPFYGIGIQN